MLKNRIILPLCLGLIVTSPAMALTFKSDGSIVQSDGTVVRDTSESRYSEALADFRAGREVTGFPVARTSSGLFGLGGGTQKAPAGYFGADIVEEGAPLFPLPTTIDSGDPISSIAENLGMSKNQFTAALVSTANDDWLEDNNIAPEVVPNFEQTVDTFLTSEEQAAALLADGYVAVNASGLTAEDVRTGELDDLLSDPEALLEAAPFLVGAPVEVQMAFQARAQSFLAEETGLELPEFDAVTLDVPVISSEELAEIAQAETEKLLEEGINAINGTDLTVADVLAGKLDDSIGISTAIINASDDVFAAYERRISEKLAEEAGISLAEIDFVNQAVLDAGVSSAEEAGRVAAEAASRFQQQAGAQAILDADIAAREAESLAQIAEELQQAAIDQGTEEAQKAAFEASQAAESASEAARLAGEAASQAAGGSVLRSVEEAAWEAASQTAYEQAIQAASAAGKSAEDAAAEAAQAAAVAGQAAFEAAAIAAGLSAEEAAAEAAAEAAEQSALRDLERRLESGELTPEEFQDAIQDVPDGSQLN